jgi:Na+/H+ antiporter NhaC
MSEKKEEGVLDFFLFLSTIGAIFASWFKSKIKPRLISDLNPL